MGSGSLLHTARMYGQLVDDKKKNKTPCFASTFPCDRIAAAPATV